MSLSAILNKIGIERPTVYSSKYERDQAKRDKMNKKSKGK